MRALSHRTRSVAGALAVWAALLLFTPFAAQAQSGFDGQRFNPAAGGAGGMEVERAVVLQHLGYSVGLMAHYANDPVVLRGTGTGAILARPLRDALTLNVLGSIGLFNFLEIAVDVPVSPLYSGQPTAFDGNTLAATAGFGDIRLVPKVAGSWNGPVTVSLGGALPIGFPTGSPSGLRGNGTLTLRPMLLFAVRGQRWAVNANAGIRIRPGGPAVPIVGQEMTFGLGAQVALVPNRDVLDLMLEAANSTFLTDNPDLFQAPVELLAGLAIRPHPDWTVNVGGGAGITRGLEDPRFRLVAGFRYAPRPASDYADNDRDGVSDATDRCPRQAEDQDGFEDADGCPEADNDRDGVLDERDECPDEPEGRLGDGDGCPEGDVRYEKGRILITGKVQFETGSSSLKPKSQRLLDKVAALLKRHPEMKRVVVEGHTDEVGSTMTNQQLSERRAETVRDALVHRGVASQRLVARGHGESRPLAPNATAAGRAKNRRVDFIIE